MTTYTNTFGGNAIKPADVSYNTLAITANATLNWPSVGVAPYTSSIMEISSDAARDVTMPDARLVGAGETVSIKNTGSFTLTIKDSAGGAIVSITAGLMYDVYVKTNATAAGTWGYLQRGAGSSSVDASALDGNGLEASGGELRVKSQSRSLSISSSISESDRAKTVVWTSGGGTFTLGAAATLSDGWYCFIKNNGSGTLTIAVTGSEVFNGTTDVTVSLTPGQGYMVSTDGANFNTLAMDPPTAETFAYVAIAVAGTGTYTLSSTEYANQAIKFTGLLTGARTIVVPTPAQQWIVNNATTGAFDLTVKTSAGTGVIVTQTKSAILYSDGTNVVASETDEGAGISTPVSIADGGTGATDEGTALTNLGGTATGVSIFSAANAAAVRSVAAAAGTGDANIFTATQTTTSTDAGAGEAPIDDNFRNSASPAASDIGGAYTFSGKSSTGVTRIYSKIRSVFKTVTNAAEDGLLAIRTILAGAEADRIIVGAGLYGAGTTGGDKGQDTANFTALYEAGAEISTLYPKLASANTFTANQTIATVAAQPSLILRHNKSGVGAANDELGQIDFYGKNDANADALFACIDAILLDPAAASKDGEIRVIPVVANTQILGFSVHNGAIVGSATGGYQGPGTINATAFYDDGVLLASGLAAASQAEQEAASSTSVATTPGTQHFHPSAAKFWMRAAGTGTLTESYNVTSVTDTDVGDLDVTVATDFSTATWCLVASIVTDSLDTAAAYYNRHININAQAAGTFGLQAGLWAEDTSVVVSDVDPISYNAAGFGDQA